MLQNPEIPSITLHNQEILYGIFKGIRDETD